MIYVVCRYVHPYCSIQDEDGFFIWTLTENSFIDSSRASWLPEKYEDTALWNSKSCFAITFTSIIKMYLNLKTGVNLLCYHPGTSVWSEHLTVTSQTHSSSHWISAESRPVSVGWLPFPEQSCRTPGLFCRRRTRSWLSRTSWQWQESPPWSCWRWCWRSSRRSSKKRGVVVHS